MTDSNTTITYPFRFGTSDKLVQLTQEQTDRIPYLSTLVAHKDDFLSIRNENNEYVLNSPIDYNLFMAILHSITSEQPYLLFNELPVDDNILDLFQLMDYLGVKSFSLPFLKDEDLTRSNPINEDSEKRHIEYHGANVFEARQTAAEFIIGLSKNEYNLNNSRTCDRIFSLVMIIFSNESIYSSRFRYHTLTILKEYSCSFLSKYQRNQLPTKKRITRFCKIDSFLLNDNKSLPNNFLNPFAWRGVYTTIKEHHINRQFAESKTRYFPRRNFVNRLNYVNRLNSVDRDIEYPVLFLEECRTCLNVSGLFFKIQNFDSHINYDVEENRKEKEAKSARSGYFDTQPKKPKVDKFKHRSSPKAQKHR